MIRSGPLYIGPWQEYELSLLLRKPPGNTKSISTVVSSKPPPVLKTKVVHAKQQARPARRSSRELKDEKLENMKLLYKRHLLPDSPTSHRPETAKSEQMTADSLIEWSLDLDVDKLLHAM